MRQLLKHFRLLIVVLISILAIKAEAQGISQNSLLYKFMNHKDSHSILQDFFYIIVCTHGVSKYPLLQFEDAIIDGEECLAISPKQLYFSDIISGKTGLARYKFLRRFNDDVILTYRIYSQNKDSSYIYCLELIYQMSALKNLYKHSYVQDYYRFQKEVEKEYVKKIFDWEFEGPVNYFITPNMYVYFKGNTIDKIRFSYLGGYTEPFSLMKCLQLEPIVREKIDSRKLKYFKI